MNGTLFWTLVRNELNIYKWRSGCRRFKKIAIGCLMLLAVGGLLFWKAKHGEPIHYKPVNVHSILNGFAFVAFALSLNSLSREWKEGSFYWWMSLPYSRWPMLLAKLIGVMLNSFRIFLYFYVAVKVLMAIVLYLQDPGLFSSLYWHSFIVDVKSLPQAIPFAFALSAIGFSVSCLMFSRFRPYAFVCWIVYGLTISLFIHANSLHLGGMALFVTEILFGVLIMAVNSLLLNRYMEAK